MALGVFRSFVAFLFGAAVVVMMIDWFDFTKRLLGYPTIFIVLATFAAMGYLIRKPQSVAFSKPWWVKVIFVVGMIMLVPFSFMFKVFGTYDFGTLLVVIRDNPPGEMLTIGLGTLAEPIREYTAVFVALTLGGLYLMGRVPYFSAAALALGATFVVASPISYFAFRQVVPDPYHALVEIPSDFQVPEIVARPDEQKNVIFLYLESVERTYDVIPEVEEAFRPLADIEDAGLTFDNVAQVYGAHFTAAGMFSSQCGAPLLPRGIVNVFKKTRERTDLDVYDFDDFMNHIECLGDVLKGDGYIGSYINGSDLAVFNKGLLFESHGYDRVFGVNSLEGPREEVYENYWGLSDATVFEKATEELEYLVGLDQPFMMSVLTLSTHGPDAELDESCDFPVVEESRIPAAIYCTGEHVQRLVQTVDDLGIADDTIIVVLSDHLAMRNSVWHLIQRVPEMDRRNYVTVLNLGEKGIVSKAGSMLDVYPTILELMGYEIADGRANFGTSLMDADPALIEQWGRTQMSSAFRQNGGLQRFLWNEEVFQEAFLGTTQQVVSSAD